MARVRDVVGSDGWVMRDLLDDEVCLATTVPIGPVAVEEPGSHVTKSFQRGAIATHSPSTGFRGLKADVSVACDGVSKSSPLLLGPHGVIT
jgi:hypothetical protein